MSENHHKVLIIGSGPAGLSAALYAARADLEPLVLTGMELGGQVSITHIVENYPGFPEGVSGPEMTELFQKQAERFGAKLEFDSATKVDLSERPFRVTCYNGEYLADILIIATGEIERWHEHEELCERFRPIVLPRAGYTDDPCALPEVSSTKVRAWLEAPKSEEAQAGT